MRRVFAVIGMLCALGGCEDVYPQGVTNGVYPLVSGGQTVGLFTVNVSCPAQATTLPVGAYNLTISSVTSSNELLTWSVLPNETNFYSAFEIRRVLPSSTLIWATVPATSRSYLAGMLLPSTPYTWQINSLISGSNDTAGAATPGSPSALQPPTIVSAVSTNPGVVVVTVKPNSVVAGYWPRVSVGATINTNQTLNWNLITTIPGTATGYAFGNQVSGTTNWYDFIAFDSNGNWQAGISLPVMVVVK